MKDVILSTTMLLEVGNWTMETVSLDEAKHFAKNAQNFVQHCTVKLLDIEPAQSRAECTGYDRALVIKTKGRLEFGKEYTVEEIEQIGYDLFLISRQ